MKRGVALASASALALLAAGPVAHALRAYLARREAWTPHHWKVSRPADAQNLGLRDIAFRSRAGTTVRGWYVPSRNSAAVIVSHGSQADRASMLSEARVLAGAGFGVLLFDWPGNGESGGRIERGAAERAALLGALDYLGTRHDVRADRIGALGFSDGSYILVQVAANDQRVRAIVLEGAFGDAEEQLRAEYAGAGRLAQQAAVLADREEGLVVKSLRPDDVISRIAPRPLVVVAGTRDRTAPPALARELFDAARQPKAFWLISGAGHGGYASADPTYPECLRSFFLASLLDPPDSTRVVGRRRSGTLPVLAP